MKKNTIAFLSVMLLLICNKIAAQEEFVSPQAKFITKFPFAQITGGIIILKAQIDAIKDTFNFVLDTDYEIEEMASPFVNVPTFVLGVSDSQNPLILQIAGSKEEDTRKLQGALENAVNKIIEKRRQLVGGSLIEEYKVQSELGEIPENYEAVNVKAHILAVNPSNYDSGVPNSATIVRTTIFESFYTYLEAIEIELIHHLNQEDKIAYIADRLHDGDYGFSIWASHYTNFLHFYQDFAKFTYLMVLKPLFYACFNGHDTMSIKERFDEVCEISVHDVSLAENPYENSSEIVMYILSIKKKITEKVTADKAKVGKKSSEKQCFSNSNFY